MTSQSLDSILSNIDCSKVKDICTNQPIPHFQLVQHDNTTTIIRDDHFNTTDFLSQCIRLVLTPEALYYLEQHNTSYKLVYPPLSITDTLIRPTLVDREIMGEYSIELRLHEKNIQVLQTADEKCRNDWIHNMDDPLLWRFLIDSKRMLKPRKKTSLIRRKDILSFYTDQAGEISPESSSDESEANDDDDDYSWEEGGAQSTQNDAAGWFFYNKK
jgi:hypothetical protein